MTRFDVDNRLDDAGDSLLRRVLVESGGARAREAPPDLVARAARALPQAPPVEALHQEKRELAARRILRSSSLLAVLALVALSGWGTLGTVRAFQMPRSGTPGEFTAAILPQFNGWQLSEPIIRGTFGALVGFGLLLPCALLLARWPHRTAIGAVALLRGPWRALAIGLPLGGAVALLQLLALQLTTAAVGLPLAALLFALTFGVQLIGLTTLVRALGARIEGRRLPAPELESPTAAMLAVLALVLALLAVLTPVAALAAFALLAAPGLGAAVVSRVGTRQSLLRS